MDSQVHGAPRQTPLTVDYGWSESTGGPEVHESGLRYRTNPELGRARLERRIRRQAYARDSQADVTASRERESGAPVDSVRDARGNGTIQTAVLDGGSTTGTLGAVLDSIRDIRRRYGAGSLTPQEYALLELSRLYGETVWTQDYVDCRVVGVHLGGKSYTATADSWTNAIAKLERKVKS